MGVTPDNVEKSKAYLRFMLFPLCFIFQFILGIRQLLRFNSVPWKTFWNLNSLLISANNRKAFEAGKQFLICPYFIA